MTIQWSNSSSENSGAMSNRLRYLVRRPRTASASDFFMARKPFRAVLSGTANLRSWYCGLLSDGRWLKPVSNSFCQLSGRWK